MEYLSTTLKSRIFKFYFVNLHHFHSHESYIVDSYDLGGSSILNLPC